MVRPCSINGSWPSIRKYFNYLGHLSRDKRYKLKICSYVSFKIWNKYIISLIPYGATFTPMFIGEMSETYWNGDDQDGIHIFWPEILLVAIQIISRTTFQIWSSSLEPTTKARYLRTWKRPETNYKANTSSQTHTLPRAFTETSITNFALQKAQGRHDKNT